MDQLTWGGDLTITAQSREAVNSFYSAALDAGGKDNGPPRLRDTSQDYPPGYYAAFVLDPDGNNIEAVCRELRSSGVLPPNKLLQLTVIPVRGLPAAELKRWAIEQTRAWAHGEIKVSQARDKAFGANAAGQAVAVAHVAAHQLGAAAYAIKAVRAAAPTGEAESAARLECSWRAISCQLKFAS